MSFVPPPATNKAPTSDGPLKVKVTSNNGTTAEVQVATVVPSPTVSNAAIKMAKNAPTLKITGSGFDTTNPANNKVTLNWQAIGTVTAVNGTGTQLTVSFTPIPPNKAPTSTGSFTAIVSANSGSSGPTAVQVAIVVNPPTVTTSNANLLTTANSIVIKGSGFDTTANGVNNVVTFDQAGVTGTVSAVNPTGTQITVMFGATKPGVGMLKAFVTSNGGVSGPAPGVQVANVVAP